MMIRESDLNHEVADRALPFQDAFAVLFFVAIGMLFDPAILINEPLKVFTTATLIIAGKFLVTFAIILSFQYSIKKSIMVSAALAQIGEFSFILIALGASAGLLSDEARNLILAGAMISIALNPFLFKASRKFCKRYEGEAVQDDDLAHLEKEEGKALRNFVILVGHGRVGSEVAKALNADHVDLVVIDHNRELIESLREKGYHALAADAGDELTLKDAFIEKALAVIITVPDPFEARRIVETTQRLNPAAKIIVRSHNHDETRFFETQNVDMAVTATDEIARRMVWGLEQFALARKA
jgi:CPA2 family monovalent cation:H+ antiporter-2